MKGHVLYKPLNEQWLPYIPEHWETQKIKYTFSERLEKGHPEEALLVSSQNMGVVPKEVFGNRTVEATKDLHLLKLVKVGDFVISLRSFQGGIEYAYYQGIISPAYTILFMKCDSINTAYFRYLAKSAAFIALLKLCVTGIREGQNIDYKKLKEHKIPVPPRAEQDQIVRFLDWKVSEINKLISISRKKAVEYRELRKAVIDQGVLHGFTNTGVIHSEIHWLGDIPQGWKVMPLKRICKVNASIVEQIRKADDNDMVTFLPMENVSETGLLDCSIKRTVAEVKTGFSSFAKGDVVVAKITPCFENGKGACLDSLDTEIGFGTTEFINLRPSKNVLSKYLYMITVTRPFRKFGESVMTGSAGQKRVPASFIKNFSLGIPPVYEQEIILRKIEQQLAQIYKCIDIEQRKVEALHELKTKLISDVTTGKIDVRDVQIPSFDLVEEDIDEEKLKDNDETDESGEVE